jgi:tetratricopeptide (TPR) repeat protein
VNVPRRPGSRPCKHRGLLLAHGALAALLATIVGPRAAAGATPPPSTLVVPLAVEGAPAAWAREAAPSRLAPIERLRRLSHALLAGGRPIAEQTGPTTTAAEVFRDRRANCVGYATLFVGLAREVGVPAYFVLVDGLPGTRGERRGDSLAVAEGHLAGAFGAGDEVRVFDLAGETPGERLRVRPITDLAAIAVFYSNRGVEALLEGDDEAAVAWLRAAADLEPATLASTWVNLGVALRRTGDHEGANAAYERALELDPEGGAAYRNLAALLALRGDAREAGALLTTAAALTGLDSLTALELARRRLLEGRVQEARGLYRRALDLARAAVSRPPSPRP